MASSKILIVEDEAITGHHLQNSLVKLGYTVLDVCPTGEEAFELVKKTPPDLVLMDIHLAGDWDGIQTSEKIRQTIDIPVVYLTAYADPQTLERAKITGPFGYLLKPFDERTLPTTVEMALHKHSLERELRQSEERFRTLVENQAEGLVIVKPDGEFIFANPAAGKLFGVTVTELIGMRTKDFSLPEYEEILDKIMDGCRNNQRSTVEIKITRTDMAERLVQVFASPWFGESGRIDGAFCILRDITEARLIHQAEREQRALAEALRDTAAVLTSTLDMNEVFDRILENVGRVVPHETANIMLVENENQIGRVVRMRGYSNQDHVDFLNNTRVPFTEISSFNLMYRTLEPLCIPDVRKYGDWRTNGSSTTRSYVGAPIHILNRVLGFLNLNHPDPNFFTSQHAERLQIFANQAAIAIENAKLYRESQNRTRIQAKLNEITQTAIRASDLDQLLQPLARIMTELFDADGTYFTEWHAEDRSTNHLATYGLNTGSRARDNRVPNERTLTASVIDLGRPIVIEDSQNTPHVDPALAATWSIRSLLALPLFVEDNPVGAAIVGFKDPHSFSAEDVALGEQAANQIALAIAKVRFYSELRALAVTDELTGLYNRRGLFDQANKLFAQAQRFDRPLSAIWLDLDNFKQVNDLFEDHGVGDEVIQSAARVFRSCIRAVDLVGRYGGDEFIFILPETEQDEAVMVAERIRADIDAQQMQTRQGEFHVTASLGVSTLNSRVDDLAALVNQADQAMYTAKQTGRNRVCIFNEESPA